MQQILFPPWPKGGGGGVASPADSGRRTSAPGRVPWTTANHMSDIYTDRRKSKMIEKRDSHAMMALFLRGHGEMSISTAAQKLGLLYVFGKLIVHSFMQLELRVWRTIVSPRSESIE
jgi:hypothetical protein